MGRFSILILLVIIVIGCKTYYKNDAGGIRPKKAKFTYNNPPYQLKKEDLIDPNSIYVEDDIFYDKTGKSIDTLQRFYRFFANGRCAYGYAVEKHKRLKYYNNIKGYREIGYYKIDGNHIEIEMYSLGGQFVDVPYYTHNYYILTKDSLKKSDKGGYARRKIEGLTGTPDW